MYDPMAVSNRIAGSINIYIWLGGDFEGDDDDVYMYT